MLLLVPGCSSSGEDAASKINPTASPANPNLSINLEVWDDIASVQFEEGEMISSMDEIKKQLLKNCKTELNYQVGLKIRAINQARATVGIGKITSVEIGEVYKAFQPLYGTAEQVNGDEPPSLNPTFISPCIFSGEISNLRSADFYTFYIGGAKTGEYDSVALRNESWKLDLVVEKVACFNFEKLNIPRGCGNY